MKKVTKLERLYEDMEKAYGQSTEEQMKEAMDKLQKEIDGKKAALSNVKGEKREALEKDVDTLEKRMNNMKGYAKNKVQIEKIKSYKANLQSKLQPELDKKKAAEERLQQIDPELVEVLNKLKDEKYTMTLDQYQYNDLVEKREALLAEFKENRDAREAAETRIADLKAKIGKCDLAWKTLFVNKDWDEIQRRAMSDEKRFTRKVDEKNPPIKAKKEEKKQESKGYDPKEVQAGISQTVQEIMEEEKESKEENKENPLPPAKLSRWQKFKNWVKEKFGRDKTDETKNSEKEDIKEPKKGERDEFLEGLRKHVDVEYRQQVKQEKEKSYVEEHKVQPKEDIEK